jgi:hypothetical protein
MRRDTSGLLLARFEGLVFDRAPAVFSVREFGNGVTGSR